MPNVDNSQGSVRGALSLGSSDRSDSVQGRTTLSKIGRRCTRRLSPIPMQGRACSDAFLHCQFCLNESLPLLMACRSRQSCAIFESFGCPLFSIEVKVITSRATDSSTVHFTESCIHQCTSVVRTSVRQRVCAQPRVCFNCYALTLQCPQNRR